MLCRNKLPPAELQACLRSDTLASLVRSVGMPEVADDLRGAALHAVLTEALLAFEMAVAALDVSEVPCGARQRKIAQLVCNGPPRRSR